MSSDRQRGGARPVTRPDDKRRHQAPRGGSKPNIARRLKEATILLMKRPRDFSGTELSEIITQAQAIAGWATVELTRRDDAAEEE